jgi:hypothetical protein
LGEGFSGMLSPTKSATLPGKMSLKRPKPVRKTVFGSNCHATAVLGCRIAIGVDENKTIVGDSK